LKDLPGLGWIFSTETEATKRSQLLIVAEVRPSEKAEKMYAKYQTLPK
jgi:type II secretory pathway component GspD/PulD (secretin)